MFSVQGYLFLKELQAEEGAGTTSGYFDNVGEVRGLHTEDVPIASMDNNSGVMVWLMLL